MSLVPRFGDMVISSLTRQCAENLESVQTIPRLFRRTNREVRLLVCRKEMYPLLLRSHQSPLVMYQHY